MHHEDITSSSETESTPGSLFVPRREQVVKPDWVVVAEADTDPTGLEVRGDHTQGEDSPRAGRRRVMYAAGAGALALGVAGTAIIISLNAEDSRSPAVAQVNSPTGEPANEPLGADLTSEPVTPSETPAISVPFSDFPVEVSEATGRITDKDGGLSFIKLGDPWKQVKVPKDAMAMGFHRRQEIVTETNSKSGTKWHAFAMSGHVPKSAKRETDVMKVSDNLLSKLIKDCYPGADRPKGLVNKAIKDGWMAAAHVPYKFEGIKARSSMVIAVAMDTGQKRPAIFVAAVPDTHEELNGDLNQFVTSLKASG